MIKLYDEIKKKIKENYKFLLFMLFIILISVIRLPFYIESPGGLLDIRDRVEIENSSELSGSLNLAYVTSYKANLPTLIYALLSPDWDIYKKEEIYQDDNIEDVEYRNHILLEEANSNAIYVGFKTAGENIEVINSKIYVTYIFKNANTDLKIGDQIIELNDEKINSLDQLRKELIETNNIKFKVLNDGKEYTRYAYKQMIEGEKIIGISMNEIKDFKTSRSVNFNFSESESGPSGGFMMSLAIYNYLKEDITHGLKIVGTGTIDENGNVGEIGGIEYKIKGATKKKADIFFVPKNNYDEALKVINENKLKITIVKIENINDAINYLKKL